VSVFGKTKPRSRINRLETRELQKGLARVLAILVDALRYDYVTPQDTPFMYELGLQGVSLPLRPILGYSDSIRATIFTGTYPDKH
jgi:predicted AlkP superfamily pyrophosphatase or phosphodiesterase